MGAPASVTEQLRIQVEGRWYVLATSARVEGQLQTLKRDDMFALFDRFGDILPWEGGEQGLYTQDTRYLSHLELLLNGLRPLHLNTAVKDDGCSLTVELMNPDLQSNGQIELRKGSVHLLRRKLLWDGVCHEQLRFTHHGLAPVALAIELRFDADFVDVFELRGVQRAQRGQLAAPAADASGLVFGYEGLDAQRRRTVVHFDPPPEHTSPGVARFAVRLVPGEQSSLRWQIACETPGASAPTAFSHHDAWHGRDQHVRRAASERCRVSSSNPMMNRWLDRSASDLDMLTTALPSGPFPYAGVPWFCTTFGRDALLTAHQCLWLQPGLARGVLAFLAETQATSEDASTDAEPGKILHEARDGEMAALGEVPFGRYYGSADATPLFVLLAGAAFARTGDLELARELWPHVERALEWMRDHGDRDGDGLIEYAKCSPTGLVNQGWKDSHDSIFHAGGELAAPPIAPCEIQGYAFAALRSAALLARALGDEGRGRALDEQAEGLRRTIEELYWCEELGSYALALDGRKRPCRVRASNAGHLLFCGVPSPERAARLTETLMDKSSHSGWGIRTVATGEARYNPMAYHNGSVWPHDNALIAAGFGRYGFQDSAAKVLGGLFEASLHMPLRRMPELFCGFTRRQGEGPTSYPLACSPQSWAAASVFLLVQSCLGLSVDALRREVQFFHPVLPAAVRQLRISRLAVADASLDVLLTRDDEDVGVTITRREGRVNVVVVK